MGNRGENALIGGGVDIGGTKVRWIIVRTDAVRDEKYARTQNAPAELHVIAAREMPTPHDRRAFIAMLRGVFGDLHRRGVRRVGVSAAGTIAHNEIVSSHNLPLLRDVRFAPLAPRGMRIAAANDARCFALGEARFSGSTGVRVGGSAKLSPALAIMLGTGVGRALIKNGAVAHIVKFERAEPWEKDYQKNAGLPAAPLAAFLAPHLAAIARANGARAVILGGGRLRTPDLFAALARELRRAGFHGRVIRSHYHQNSAAIGAALSVI